MGAFIISGLASLDETHSEMLQIVPKLSLKMAMEFMEME